MLFHVTMTHSEDNCPGYDPAQMAAAIEGFDKLPAVA